MTCVTWLHVFLHIFKLWGRTKWNTVRLKWHEILSWDRVNKRLRSVRFFSWHRINLSDTFIDFNYHHHLHQTHWTSPHCPLRGAGKARTRVQSVLNVEAPSLRCIRRGQGGCTAPGRGSGGSLCQTWLKYPAGGRTEEKEASLGSWKLDLKRQFCVVIRPLFLDVHVRTNVLKNYFLSCVLIFFNPNLFPVFAIMNKELKLL